jgi:hypothetical protein
MDARPEGEICGASRLAFASEAIGY